MQTTMLRTPIELGTPVYGSDGQKIGDVACPSTRSRIERGISILNREDWDASPIGDKRWLLLSKVPLRDDTGHIDGMVGMAADITAQKEAEAHALEAQRALEEKNRQIEGELEIARELQTELMAASMQSVTDELDASAPFRPRLAFHYQPSAHLAGDFFQFLSVSRDAFAFILCDVMGHGVKAALVTTLLRGLLAWSLRVTTGAATVLALAGALWIVLAGDPTSGVYGRAFIVGIWIVPLQALVNLVAGGRPQVVLLPASAEALRGLVGWSLARGGAVRPVPLSAVLKAAG